MSYASPNLQGFRRIVGVEEINGIKQGSMQSVAEGMMSLGAPQSQRLSRRRTHSPTC